jgi:excisionase family DNA binding protein
MSVVPVRMVTPTDNEKRAELRRRDYLTPAEGAFLIRRNKSTITRWIQHGLTAHRVGAKRLIPRLELLRWAADPDRRTRRRTSPEGRMRNGPKPSGGTLAGA